MIQQTTYIYVPKDAPLQVRLTPIGLALYDPKNFTEALAINIPGAERLDELVALFNQILEARK